jgi:hypothetical protein
VIGGSPELQVAKYEQLSEALHWIDVTLLQVERFVDAFLTYAEGADSDATVVTADGHFLLNACAQAEKALQRAGKPIPPDRRTTIRALRDVHEHWEQHKKSFESKQHAKTRAGQRFTDAHPDHLPWAFKFDATGTFISALRLEDLWDELLALETALASELSELAHSLGASVRPAARTGQPFPRRESKAVAMAMVTQNIVLDFDNP